MPIRVLLAEDHVIVRQGLKALLEHEGFEIVAEVSNGPDAVRLARDRRPTVAVLDVAMPLLNGLDAAREIRQTCPETRVILLTVYTEDRLVLEALRAGIQGYVVKTEAASDLVRAIREVVQGRVYLSSAVSRAAVQAYVAKTQPDPDPLTPREREVLQLVAEGKTSKEIAQLLGVTVKTAETYRMRIMEKLDIHETAGLVRYAIRRGLIQP